MPRPEPTPAALRRHRMVDGVPRPPAWFEDAKLGIFVHWGLSCVPAFAPRSAPVPELLRTRYGELQALSPYAEWYENALRIPGSPTARHHAAVYGDAPYERFREPFEAKLAGWDPKPWAELFAAAGARYVVHVTKHHDGYCLWPSAVPNPRRPGWHAPRDVVGELAEAVRARGLRFGVYYSGGLDWTFEARPIRTVADGLACVPLDPAYERYADAQVRELVARVRPSVLWNDIAWPPHGGRLWRLLADYYAEVEEGVVNDRFGPAPAWLVRALRLPPVRAAADALVRRAVRRPDWQMVPPPPPVFDFRTPEYARFPEPQPRKWEATRGIGHGFGFNANEDEANLIDPDELVRTFVDVVAKNGNLLLNVGPTREGEIHPRERLRLEALGAWLRACGEAIYDTRPWRVAEGATACGVPVRFTAKGDTIHAILLATPRGGELRLRDVSLPGDVRVELLGHGALGARRAGADLVVAWPAGAPARPAHALALRPR
ncbi:MAG TPA: alpha-L-fucosidase [Myxococcota bacterium]